MPVETKQEYTILAVDDAKDSLMLLEFDLGEHNYQVVTAESGESALVLLETIEAHLILLDMHMAGISGLQTLERLKAHPTLRNVPVIMLSASGEENAIVSALELGADDYVTKPYIPRVLLARINNALRFKEKTQQLEMLAKTDNLTGLNNRGAFQELAKSAISQAKRSGQPVSIAMLDIDYFKQVNDNHGHEAGDKALKEFAIVIKETLRNYDIVGRIGGEEFAICMPDTSIEEAYLACERCRTNVQSHSISIALANVDLDFSITVSIGITAGKNESMDYDDMMRNADNALYKAKENGRNQSMLDDNLESQSPSDTVVHELPEPESSFNNDITQCNSDSEQEYPGIDYQVGVNNVLGDDGLFKEILVMFYHDHGKDNEKIGLSITNQANDDLKSLIHTLKGVSCSIGAMTLFEHCKQLDIAINQSESERYEDLYQPVKNELDLVINGIKEKLSASL